MTLLSDVVAHCRQHNVQVALVGAAALSLHGVARASFDSDLMTVDRSVLHEAFWAGFDSEVRRGDADDPLAGVVRIRRERAEQVDVIVAKYRFQGEVIARATLMPIEGGIVSLVSAADLILLKLFAGGPRDRMDIHDLLEAHPALRSDVERHLHELPEDARALWQQLQ